MNEQAADCAKRVRLMMFDVDGILTDGRLYFSASGEELKAFNTRDGQGIKLLRDQGVDVGIITARQSRVVEKRAAELGISILRQGSADKGAAFAEILTQQNLDASETGYMGDDLVDLPVLTRCGFAATVASAPEAVRSRSHYIARSAGGEGAVREVCEFVLKAQGTLEQAIAAYLP